MAITETFFNPDLATGSNDGTSEANAWQTWSQMQTDHIAGERVNAKKTASPFQPGANISFAVSATDLLVSIFRGYGSTIGDGVKFEFDMEVVNTLTVTAEAALIQTVDLTGSDVSQVVSMTGDISRIEDFKIVNTRTDANNGFALNMNDCHAFNGFAETNATDTDSTAISFTRGTVENCEVVSTRRGINNETGSRDGSVVNCLIYAKGASSTIGYRINGLTSARGGIQTNLTIDGFPTGIELTSLDDVLAIELLVITNSIISNATTGIANADNATKVMSAFLSTIAFFNISGSDSEFGDNEIQHKISLTADPFTDAGNNDYSLNNTAGGGADVRAISIFSGGETTNFRDVGAMQHEDSGGGGGGAPKRAGRGGGMAG